MIGLFGVKQNSNYKFYEGLGVEGLSSLMDEESDNSYYDFVISSVKKGNILDAGCGYGRVSIPLYQKGYDITGVDIIQEFVEYVNAATAPNAFVKGDMLHLPFSANSFDNIICMWSTFSHFLTIEEQRKVVLEMLRVLKNEGKVIIDVPTPEVYKMPLLTEVKTKTAVESICEYTVNGNLNRDYVHDEYSLKKMMESLPITNYSIERKKIGKFPRLILSFTK